jgi:hypothetical protein
MPTDLALGDSHPVAAGRAAVAESKPSPPIAMISIIKPDRLLFVELNGLVGMHPPLPDIEITVGDGAPIDMCSIEFIRASSLPVFGIRATLVSPEIHTLISTSRNPQHGL